VGQAFEDQKTRDVAREVWAEMNDSQRFGVGLGLFPFELMEPYAEFPNLAVALMDLAKGGS